MEINEFVLGTFFDLSKAFDTINHEILFMKLKNLGINGAALQWIILHSRRKTTNEKDEESEDITSNEEVFSEDISEEEEDRGADKSTTTWGMCKGRIRQFPFLVSSDLSSPITGYRNFLSDEDLDLIVSESNRYANSFILSRGKRSIIHNWKDTNSSEVKKFIAVLMMIQNVNRLSKIKTLLDVICRNFQKTLTPGESVVIDESMIPW
ncbi:hypothetical protein J437_LFUL013929 [Ladona fulva]|uniref:PiggyBac transposable element-derived protein domain-containing protein n=1 Tax=Ladona fulva TaxID=123851 RepID=A0A8K0KHF5_LADFU|nr:hypothetical protein J437_LFUL013929 [Ladona fulva]